MPLHINEPATKSEPSSVPVRTHMVEGGKSQIPQAVPNLCTDTGTGTLKQDVLQSDTK